MVVVWEREVCGASGVLWRWCASGSRKEPDLTAPCLQCGPPTALVLASVVGKVAALAEGAQVRVVAMLWCVV
jgi:hypothetical protein